MRNFALLLASLSLLVVAGAADRTWTNNTGNFKVEAEYQGYADGKVELKKTDGRVVHVPLSRLSQTDQKFVRAQLKKSRLAARARVTNKPVIASATTDWPSWRGPERNGISTETGLLDSWTDEGPPIQWQTKGLGKGYSSIAISGGKIFTMGTRQGGEHLIALDGKNGDELWALRVGPGDHSNCTPTVDGNLVFAVGLKGDLVCADTKTGKEVWRKNYDKDFGGKMMSVWGFSESPLVDGDQLIATPGSNDAILAALDKKTGKVVWTTALPADVGKRGKDGAGYSSVVISHAAGVKQYVQLVGRGVIGVDAKTGRLLWGYNRVANGTANIPTPIVRGDHIFCSSGYGTGSALLKLSGGRSGINVEEVYFLSGNEMQNHHGGMILLGDHLYCGHGHNKGLPICLDLMTGKPAWGPSRGIGSGSAAIIYADGHLYFRYEDATMALIEATPKGYNLKGSFKIASKNGRSWPHPVISQGRLYLRDQDELHCYDVRQKN